MASNEAGSLDVGLDGGDAGEQPHRDRLVDVARGEFAQAIHQAVAQVVEETPLRATPTTQNFSGRRSLAARL